MGKCLVTKLQGIVNNSSLPILGKMNVEVSRVSNPKTETQVFYVMFSEDEDIKIIGDGYFTDTTLQQNLGKTKRIPANVNLQIAVSNGNFYVQIPKYGIKSIASVTSNIGFDIDDLQCNKDSLTYLKIQENQRDINIQYLKEFTHIETLSLANCAHVNGDISSLAGMTGLKYLDLYKTQCSGDISNLTGMTGLKYLSIGDTRVSGDISSLAGMTELTTLSLFNTQCSGDISSLAGLKKLETLTYANTNIVTDIAKLSGLSNLRTLRLEGKNSSGDLSKAPANIYGIFGNGNFTWDTERPSGSTIFGMSTPKLKDNVDKMLINLAKCTKSDSSPSDTSNFVISVYGTRTSASDSAVQTLQSKGYTVSIIPAQ